MSRIRPLLLLVTTASALDSSLFDAWLRQHERSYAPGEYSERVRNFEAAWKISLAAEAEPSRDVTISLRTIGRTGRPTSERMAARPISAACRCSRRLRPKRRGSSATRPLIGSLAAR